MIDKIIDYLGHDEIMIADDLNEAVIGICAITDRIIYSVRKCIEILMTQNMGYDEAVEFFEYNVLGSYVGIQTPIWCYDNF